MTEFIALRAKTYAYRWIKYNNQISEKKKAKGTKKFVIREHLNFQHYKRTLFNNETRRCTQQRFRSDHHVIDTVNINEIALSNKDDKRLQTFDEITTYPIGKSPYVVCESEMQQVLKNKHQLAKSYLDDVLKDRPELVNKIKDRPKYCDSRKLAELRNITTAMYY